MSSTAAGPAIFSVHSYCTVRCCCLQAVGRLYEDLRAYQEVATQARLRSAGTSQRARPHGSVQAPAVQQYQVRMTIWQLSPPPTDATQLHSHADHVVCT